MTHKVPHELIVELRDILAKYFSLGELRTLCFDLRIDYTVPSIGSTTNAAEEIVRYCRRHFLVDKLIKHLKKKRPSVPEIQRLDQGNNQSRLEQSMRDLNYGQNPFAEEIKTSDLQISLDRSSEAGEANLFTSPLERPIKMTEDVSREDLVQIRNILANRFIREEIKDLCFELGIPKPVGNLKTMAREIVLYFYNRYDTYTLVDYIRKERPKSKIKLINEDSEHRKDKELKKSNHPKKTFTSEQKQLKATDSLPNSSKAESFELNEWLEKLNFRKNPFQISALWTELDDVESFVDLAIHERVRALSRISFVIAPSGSGKTSLCQRIGFEFDKTLLSGWYRGRKILAITYIPDLISSKVIDSHAHTQQIILAVRSKTRKIFKEGLEIGVGQPLNNLIGALLKQYQIDGLFIMVDLNNSGSISLLNPLIAKTGLFDIENIFFRFFLPTNLLEFVLVHGWPIDKFPAHKLHWQSEDLAMLLSYRLQVCLDNNFIRLSGDSNDLTAKDNAIALLSNICAHSSLVRTFDALIGVREDDWQPRDMLRLGYYLLEEHFCGDNSRRSPTDLIQLQSLDIALKRLKREKEFLSQTPIWIGGQVDKSYIDA